MGAELGRISGPLLSANLLRDGIDLAFETDLLYFDVVNQRIGIKTDVPTRQLTIDGTVGTTNLIVDTQTTIANLTFVSNKIQNLSGAINIAPAAGPTATVTASKFSTANLEISDQLIKNITANSNIVIDPTGQTIFTTSEVQVNGNLHATGDITWDGSITIGSDGTDNITFSADVASDIVPDITNFYDIGTSSQRWNTTYTRTLTAEDLTLGSLTVAGVDFLLTQGNTIYVSVNGLDTNTGEHLHNTYRTIKKALSVAQPGDEIVIFPGTYQEEFPLTVPQGVSVKGAGIRSVTVVPTLGTNTKDAFLLNGETTVSYLTVKDFYYDSTNNTGYGFRLANGCKVTTRSPYVFHCTIITSTPNAGCGALIDGAVVTTDSKEATILFFSTTMIVPGANGITATNGARCEWLNSFTYYALRGIYLTQGTLGFASQGARFGAEMRSINSANVYGTYGAVADGANTLAYLIGHNFGYVGSGTNNLNDDSIVLQTNEVVELNGGTIYYDSVDHKGNYRVGDIFYVNQETGLVSLNAQSIDFGNDSTITFEGTNSSTTINKFLVETGNIRLYDNNVDSLSGPVNLKAASNFIYLNTNVDITGDLAISNSVNVDGNIYLGDTPFDTITVTPNLTQDIVPGTTGLTLGLPLQRWDTLYSNLVNVDNVINIDNNTISTLTTNTDLRLVASGTGKIKISSTDVLIENNLTVANTVTVNGLSSLQDISQIGNTQLVGNINQTGDTFITGTFANNNLAITDIASYFEVNSIRIFENTISAQTLNDDLVFTANGTGGVVFDDRLRIRNNEIANIVSPQDPLDLTFITEDGQILTTEDGQNLLADTRPGWDLSVILEPTGTGNVVISSTRAIVLPRGNNATRAINTIGEVRQNDVTNLYEGWTPNGAISLNAIYDVSRNTSVTAEVTPGNNDNFLRFVTNGTARASISSTSLTTNNLWVDNIAISGNTINNRIAGNDLVIQTEGTGTINLNNLPIARSIIYNTQNTALTLASTGLGYVKFSGSGAMYVPIGPNADRRLTPEIGEVRNNSEVGYMEVWNGSAWSPAIGTSGSATEAEVLEIIDLWTIILG